jgi:farnesyl-diphosphate farnesyltransferase
MRENSRCRRALNGSPLAPLPAIHALDAHHQALLSGVADLFQRLSALTPALQGPTRRVLQRLMRGMHLELSELAEHGAVRRNSAFQTMCWTYRAAGCVGAYWNALLALEAAPRGALEERSLRRAAIRLGLGLQQVNLLRDRHEDAARHRYLLAGLSPSGEPVAMERAWIAHARSNLLQGYQYASHGQRLSRRDRFAIVLPIRIGLATLNQLEAERARWLAGERIKISRTEMRREMRGAFLDALFAGRMQRQLRRASVGSFTACPA